MLVKPVPVKQSAPVKPVLVKQRSATRQGRDAGQTRVPVKQSAPVKQRSETRLAVRAAADESRRAPTGPMAAPGARGGEDAARVMGQEREAAAAAAAAAALPAQRGAIRAAAGAAGAAKPAKLPDRNLQDRARPADAAVWPFDRCLTP